MKIHILSHFCLPGEQNDNSCCEEKKAGVWRIWTVHQILWKGDKVKEIVHWLATVSFRWHILQILLLYRSSGGLVRINLLQLCFSCISLKITICLVTLVCITCLNRFGETNIGNFNLMSHFLITVDTRDVSTKGDFEIATAWPSSESFTQKW